MPREHDQDNWEFESFRVRHVVNRLDSNPKYDFKLGSVEQIQISKAQYPAQCIISTERRGTTTIPNHFKKKTWETKHGIFTYSHNRWPK